MDTDTLKSECYAEYFEEASREHLTVDEFWEVLEEAAARWKDVEDGSSLFSFIGKIGVHKGTMLTKEQFLFEKFDDPVSMNDILSTLTREAWCMAHAMTSEELAEAHHSAEHSAESKRSLFTEMIDEGREWYEMKGYHS